MELLEVPRLATTELFRLGKIISIRLAKSFSVPFLLILDSPKFSGFDEKFLPLVVPIKPFLVKTRYAHMKVMLYHFVVSDITYMNTGF